MTEADGLLDGLLYLAAAELMIQACRLYEEAGRCECRNPPWARNRRRHADRLVARAWRLCGGKTPYCYSPNLCRRQP